MGNQLKELFDKIVENRMRRAIALTLAIIVTFTTTYALVLPAITLEKDTAETMSGVDMGGNEQNGDTSTSSEKEESSKDDSDSSEADTVSFDAEAKNEDGETETLVHVEADANAFPEGTTMEASVVTDQDVIDSITEATEGEVVAVRAVDLTFTDKNGETVQPAEGSQVSVALSPGEGEVSDAQNEETASDSNDETNRESSSEPSAQTEEGSENEIADEQNTEQQATETTVVQYTEDNGAETVEINEDVSFQVEPENDLDQDNAVSFDMSEQMGEEDSQTYAIVETVAEDNGEEEDVTDEAVPSGAGPEAEEIVSEEQEIPSEALTEEPEEGVLTAQDESYLITMSYGSEAQIPQGASLKVEEILSEEKAYDDHLEETQKALNEAAQTEAAEEDGVYAGPDTEEEPQFFGARSLMDDPDAYDRQQAEAASAPETEIVYARFFDITILDADGGEVTPEAPVKVSIELLDTEEDEQVIQNADAAQVIHFGEEAPEVMEADTLEDTIAGVTFDTESFSVYGVVYTVDFSWEVDGKMYEFSLPGGGFVSFSDLVEMLDIIGDTNSDNNGDEKWADIAGFVSCVESLEFTNPGLMDVSKAEADTTVGQIKESRELACEYSTELTEEQIEEINAQTVEAGDWALISLQPFLSEEMLTVTMNDGEIFTIMVTDAQIRRDVLTADGETYTITLTYSPFAGIPDDADLVVREITEGEEFARYLSDSAAALSIPDEDVSFARFFDIEIVDGAGEKVEPLEPVQVTIAYTDAIESSGEESLNVVHFAETGTEVINEVSLSEDGSEITYEQSSFSVTGTIQTGAPTNGGYYMLLVDYNGKTYMVNNDGTLTEVTTGQDANGNPDPNKIAVEYPMLWTYYYQYGGHFRFASEASGFNADNTASGYYYKYIDPNSDAGLREEHKNGDQNNLVGQTVVTYHDNSISNASYNKYIGVSEEGGVLHIVGNTDGLNAATIRLASATNVLPSDPLKHSVNHIDIGFDASATVTVPPGVW